MAVYGLTLAEEEASTYYQSANYNSDGSYTPPSVADGYGGRVAVGPLRPEVAQVYNAANSAPVIPNYVYNEGFNYTSPLQNTPKPQDNMMPKTSSSPWLGTRVEENTAPKTSSSPWLGTRVEGNTVPKTSSSPWLGTRVEGNTVPKPAEHKGGMYLFKQDYKIEKNTVNPQLQVGPHPGVNDSLRPVTVPIVILPKNEDYNIKK